MTNAWNRFDRLCLEAMDGFMVHLQSVFRLHYTTALTGFGLAAAVVSAFGGLLMFRGSFEWMRVPAGFFWAVLIVLLIRWFAGSYWRDRRNWDAGRHAYWLAFSRGLEIRTRPFRAVYVLLPVVLSLTAISDFAEGRLDLAASTLLGNFVSFAPMLMLLCALCSPPRPATGFRQGRNGIDLK